jgi:hypothetical protein
MCSPALASLGVQAEGGIASAAGAMFSASAQKMGLKLDATLSGINADRARDNAREALREGYDQEVKQRLMTGQIKGQERAAMGANNVDMTTGSALTRLISTDYMGEADAQTIRLNAARVAMGYRDQASNYDIRGTIDRGEAKGISPFLTGATSLLGSASSIASNWYSMRNAGMFGSNPAIPSPNLSAPMSVNLGSTAPLYTDTSADLYRYGTIG